MRLLIFGLGYSAARIAALADARGWHVTGTSRDGRDGTLAFDAPAMAAEIAAATHILSSVPPEGDGDPVLERYGAVLARLSPSPSGEGLGWGRSTVIDCHEQSPPPPPPLKERGGTWLGYLSSTGVYGDAGGAWVDESAPLGGRRTARVAADRAWLALGARVFRLPGIYGPGRSPLDRLADDTAHRVDLPGQVFSRVHVDDLAAGVIAGFDAPAGAYNLADDEPAAQDAVTAYAAALLGIAPPPYVPLASLSPMARGFYAENRRVANGKAKRALGWSPAYATYREGLRAVSATTRPAPASSDPATASKVQ